MNRMPRTSHQTWQSLAGAMLLAYFGCVPSGPSAEELAAQRRAEAEAEARREQERADSQSRVKAFATEHLPDLQRAIDEAEQEVRVVERSMAEYAESVRALSGDVQKDENYRAFDKELRSVRNARDALTTEREGAYKDFLATTLSRDKLSPEERRAKKQRVDAAITQSDALVRTLRGMRGASPNKGSAPSVRPSLAPQGTSRASLPGAPSAQSEKKRTGRDESLPRSVLPESPAATAPKAAEVASPLRADPSAAGLAVHGPVVGTRPGFVAAPPPSVRVLGSRLGLR
jgi:hypothetical protein